LIAELNANGLAINCDRKVPILYKGLRIQTPLEVDLMVEGQVILETQSRRALTCGA